MLQAGCCSLAALHPAVHISDDLKGPTVVHASGEEGLTTKVAAMLGPPIGPAMSRVQL